VGFSIERLSENRIAGIKTCPDWSEECPIRLDELRSLHFLHVDFNGDIQKGEMVVAEFVSKAALDVFKELLEIKFPIHRALPSDEYLGSDVESMNDNNSSAFNCRKVMNTDRWSSHSYGVAIDMNPVQNPYVIFNHDESTAKIFPEGASMYLNRSNQRQGMVEPIVPIFKKHGFSNWGGSWDDPLDYHHFQIPRDQA
jgi:hypothetical protein